MEPTVILIYVLIVFLVIIWTLLSVNLFYLLRTLKRIDRATQFVDSIVSMLERIEKLPFELLDRFLKKFEK
ncbi:MAG: hypothetical protein ACD_49C00050G0025 [uncultured bacterium (gcode 4)]|uniref:Uncharacterized protein n=1 Tax=uncultured bacterium (gcode 4) TaxID=1234023 RepID=K2AE79_9BACT|nr:MAG: hypothetical protein ACD_49C00050G0025 [uncultured bacterium (gcode 4)]